MVDLNISMIVSVRQTLGLDQCCSVEHGIGLIFEHFGIIYKYMSWSTSRTHL